MSDFNSGPIEIKGVRYYKTPYGYLPSVTTILKILEKGIGFDIWKTTSAIDATLTAIETLTETSLNTIDDIITNKTEIKKLARTLANQPKDEAASIGTRVHKHIEDHIKNKLDGNKKFKPVLQDDEAACWEAFERFETDNKIEYKCSEKFLFSQHGYAGTMDIAAIVGGKFSQIDIKTSNSVYNTMYYQISAYSNAWEELGGTKFDKQYILHLSKKTGKFKLIEVDYDYETFYLILQVYNRINREALRQARS